MTRIFHWVFIWKMDPMSGCDIRLVFTLPPRDSTLQYKRCVLLWNNFSCIITFVNCNLECTGTQSSAIRGREGRPHLYFVQSRKLSQNQLLRSALTIFYQPHIFFVWHFFRLLQFSLDHLIWILSHIMTLIMVLNILSCIFSLKKKIWCGCSSF